MGPKSAISPHVNNHIQATTISGSQPYPDPYSGHGNRDKKATETKKDRIRQLAIRIRFLYVHVKTWADFYATWLVLTLLTGFRCSP